MSFLNSFSAAFSTFSSSDTSNSSSSSSPLQEDSPFLVPTKLKLQKHSSNSEKNLSRKNIFAHENSTTHSNSLSSSSPSSVSFSFSSFFSSVDSNDGADLDLKFTKEKVQDLRNKRRRMKLGFLSNTFDDDSLNYETEIAKENNKEEENNYEQSLQNVDDMGIKIEPFNMKKELKEGSFDEEGHYIFKKKRNLKSLYFEKKNIKCNKNAKNQNENAIFDEEYEDYEEDDNQEVTDSWLGAVDAGDAFVSFKSEEERKKIIQKKEEQMKIVQNLDLSFSLRNLLRFLKNNETPAGCLKRIKREGILDQEESNESTNAKKHSVHTAAESENFNDETDIRGMSKHKDHIDSTNNSHSCSSLHSEMKDSNFSNAEENKNKKERKKFQKNKLNEESKKQINEITEICNFFLNEGKNLYFKNREDLLKMLTTLDIEKSKRYFEKEKKSTQEFTELNDTYWEFRWINALEKEVFGPYHINQMILWMEQGYITKDNPIEARRVTLNAPNENSCKEEKKEELAQQEERNDWLCYEDLPFTIYYYDKQAQEREASNATKEECAKDKSLQQEREREDEEQEKVKETLKMSKDDFVLSYLNL